MGVWEGWEWIRGVVQGGGGKERRELGDEGDGVGRGW